jgi:hypothetical protein
MSAFIGAPLVECTNMSQWIAVLDRRGRSAAAIAVGTIFALSDRSSDGPLRCRSRRGLSWGGHNFFRAGSRSEVPCTQQREHPPLGGRRDARSLCNSKRIRKGFEVVMIGELQKLSVGYQLELHRWTSAWYEEVVEAGFICPTYEADNETISRLYIYFNAGLSPIEAAQALFGEKH